MAACCGEPRIRQVANILAYHALPRDRVMGDVSGPVVNTRLGEMGKGGFCLPCLAVGVIVLIVNLFLLLGLGLLLLYFLLPYYLLLLPRQ